MRYLLDIIAVLCVLLASAVVYWYLSSAREAEQRVLRVHEQVQLIASVAAAHSAMPEADTSPTGHVRSIDTEWFDGDVPINALLPPPRPWLEIASADQAHMTHPPNRAATNATHASFWYNPANGVVRARVPMQTTDQATLDLYNKANGCALSSLYGLERSPGPSPEAMRAQWGDDPSPTKSNREVRPAPARPRPPARREAVQPTDR